MKLPAPFHRLARACSLATVRAVSATLAFSAAAERKKACADAAKNGYWVAGAHLSLPGIGHLRREGTGYFFVPANCSVVR